MPDYYPGDHDEIVRLRREVDWLMEREKDKAKTIAALDQFRIEFQAKERAGRIFIRTIAAIGGLAIAAGTFIIQYIVRR